MSVFWKIPKYTQTNHSPQKNNNKNHNKKHKDYQAYVWERSMQEAWRWEMQGYVGMKSWNGG